MPQKIEVVRVDRHHIAIHMTNSEAKALVKKIEKSDDFSDDRSVELLNKTREVLDAG